MSLGIARRGELAKTIREPLAVSVPIPGLKLVLFWSFHIAIFIHRRFSALSDIFLSILIQIWLTVTHSLLQNFITQFLEAFTGASRRPLYEATNLLFQELMMTALGIPSGKFHRCHKAGFSLRGLTVFVLQILWFPAVTDLKPVAQQ